MPALSAMEAGPRVKWGASATRANADRFSPEYSFSSGGSWRSGLPGPLRFSSGEATILSYDPQLGLFKDALDEEIAVANALAPMFRGPLSSRRARLKRT
jgi:hypothetical protein